MKHLLQDIVLGLILIVVAVFVLNPGDVTMSDSMSMALETSLVGLFAFFLAAVWRERVSDERDELHRMLADRIGYLAGAGFIIFGILVQFKHHDVDKWLVGALVAMVLAKIGARVYTHLKR